MESSFKDAVVFEAGSFQELLAIVENDQPQNLIICDLKMPGMECMEGIRAIRENFPKTMLIILSGSFEQEDINQALSLGVNGFVAKTSAGASLVNIIKLVQAGETYLPSELLNSFQPAMEKMPQHWSSKELTPDEKEVLTPREKEVLKQLALGHSNKQIARILSIEESTVKSHIKNIYDKLGVSNRTQAAKVAFGIK